MEPQQPSLQRTQLLRQRPYSHRSKSTEERAASGKRLQKKKRKSDDIENEVFIENDITYIQVSKPDVKKKKKKSKIIQRSSGVRSGSRRRRKGAGLSRGIWLSRTVGGKGLFRLLVTRDVKIEVQTQVGISRLPLKGKPSRSPLSAGLIPQTRYSSVPLNNQSFLPLKVSSQPMALLSQAFNKAYSLGSFETGSI